MKAQELNKTIRIGTVDIGNKKTVSLFCKIKFTDGKLSITGVEGPMSNGDACGGCGQIVMSDWKVVNYAPGWTRARVNEFRMIWSKWHLNDLRPNCQHQVGPEWTPKNVIIYHFRLKPEVEKSIQTTKEIAIASIRRGESFHPTAEETRLASLPTHITNHVDERPVDYVPNCPQYSGDSYNKAIEEKSTDWLTQKEHPEGYLSKPCPVCGYKYGSAWLCEEVPAEVIDFLASLPDADQKPAWV